MTADRQHIIDAALTDTHVADAGLALVWVVLGGVALIIAMAVADEVIRRSQGVLDDRTEAIRRHPAGKALHNDALDDERTCPVCGERDCWCENPTEREWRWGA